MTTRRLLCALVPLAALAVASPAATQTSELPPVVKVRNYLPHMTRPEVEDLLTRSDMVVIPVAALEQHGTHGGNRAITTFIVDRINQETPGIAVDLGAVAGPLTASVPAPPALSPRVLDRHGGTGETSASLYLIPGLVDLEAAYAAELSMPAHLEAMVDDVLSGDPTALAVFLAEGLKAEETGKGTSSLEMSTTGVWGVRDPREATAERGRAMTEAFVDAAVAFIERWNRLRPPGTG